MASSPQLSLCVPVVSDFGSLQEFTDNIHHFFQKFPVSYEVLFSLNLHQDQSRSFLQHLSERSPQYRIIENEGRQSRAQNLCSLFTQARGEVLVTMDIGLEVPLSEVFKILEVFFSDPAVGAVFGNRAKAKKNLMTKPVREDRLEKFFGDVLKDKTTWKFADPFCPVLGLRRDAFELIKKDLKSSGWHWTPEVQRVSELQAVKSIEIPLLEGAQKGPRPPKSEVWHLLRFVLFRI